MPQRSNGFTLLEVLVVLALIGVIASIFYFSLRPAYQRAALNEAVMALSSELSRARSTTQRLSQSAPLVWTTTTIQGVPLPNGVQITTPPEPGWAYTAPYSELLKDGQPSDAG